MRTAELIIGIELPPSPFADHSWYLKVRDRHSYAFALVSVAAGLSIRDGVIEAAAVALGGVAAKPWRVPEADAGLIGQQPTQEVFRQPPSACWPGPAAEPERSTSSTLGRHAVVRR